MTDSEDMDTVVNHFADHADTIISGHGEVLPVTRQRRNGIVERWIAETKKIEEENRFEENVERWLSDLLAKAQENLDRLREGSAHWQVAVEDGTAIVERLEQALERVQETRPS